MSSSEETNEHSDGINRRYAPCATCPFRKHGKGLRLLGRERAEGIRDSLLNDESFTCHSDLDLPIARRAQCVGAMLILQKLGRTNTAMRLLRYFRMMDLSKLRGSKAVFDDFDQWTESQERPSE